MRKEVFGIVYAGEENLNLRELVNLRSVGALPVGARYRVVDFVLSNLVHSGIRTVGVIPRRNYHSLMDHLGSGKEWDLNRKNEGLLIIPPYDTSENTGTYHGLIDTLKGASAYIRRASQPYCLLAGCGNIHTSTYREMFEFHKETGADVTILYHQMPQNQDTGNLQDVKISTSDTGRVIDMSMSNTAYNKLSMSVYIIKKDLLQYLVADASSRGKYNFASEVLMNNLTSLRVYGYEHKGYVGRVHSVASYYQINMDFLRPEVQKDLFYTGNTVYTKIKDEAPTKYGSEGVVSNCLIGSGCIIDGQVENCILFRGVHIAKGTVVKNSIIMQGSEVYAGSKLDNVILDKHVTVRPNSTLVGSRAYPVIIPKGASV